MVVVLELLFILIYSLFFLTGTLVFDVPMNCFKKLANLVCIHLWGNPGMYISGWYSSLAMAGRCRDSSLQSSFLYCVFMKQEGMEDGIGFLREN